jgi:hypothetical protein
LYSKAAVNFYVLDLPIVSALEFCSPPIAKTKRRSPLFIPFCIKIRYTVLNQIWHFCTYEYWFTILLLSLSARLSFLFVITEFRLIVTVAFVSEFSGFGLVLRSLSLGLEEKNLGHDVGFEKWLLSFFRTLFYISTDDKSSTIKIRNSTVNLFHPLVSRENEA